MLAGDARQRGALLLATIEARAVLRHDPPQDWGIRSRLFKLTADDYVEADMPRLYITPALLSAFHDYRSDITNDRALAFKTWLGLRYDRPAVPRHLVAFAKEIAKRCRRPGGKEPAARVHDVLMQFSDNADPPQAALFAVVERPEDKEPARQWLASVALAINTDLGVIAHIDVGTKDETSLFLIETSYAADVSQLTWRDESPTGAV